MTVSAKVLDQYGQVMTNLKPTYSVAPSYSGVSVNSTSGLVTIVSTAAVGKANMQATYTGLPPANAELTLSKAASVPTTIVFDPASYETAIPNIGSTAVTVSAKVLDQYGNIMPGLTPTYSVTPTYSGVVVNSSGEVTVNSSSAVGTAYIKASYGSLTPTNASLALSPGSSVGESHYKLYFNNGWYVTDDGGMIDYEEADPGVYEINLGGSGSDDYTYTFSAFASGIDTYGNSITVESIVYVLYDEFENETGVFDAYDVYSYRDKLITAIATFSDGKVLEVDARINISFIQPRR